MSHWICKTLNKWMYLLPRLVSMSLSIITQSTQNDRGNNAVSHAVPLRLLEVVASPHSWECALSPDDQKSYFETVFTYVIKNGYYKNLVQLLLTRVPQVYERTTTAPIPLAESLLDLLIKPLVFFGNYAEDADLSILLSEVTQHILGLTTHTQIRNYVLPAIAQHREINCRIFEEMFNHLGSDSESYLLETVQSPALLLSLLTIVKPATDFKKKKTLANYLKVIGKLTKQTTNHIAKDTIVEEDSDYGEDDDDEEMNISEPTDLTLHAVSSLKSND